MTIDPKDDPRTLRAELRQARKRATTAEEKWLDAHQLAGAAWQEVETIYAYLRALVAGDPADWRAAVEGLLPEHPENVEEMAKELEAGGLGQLADRWRALNAEQEREERDND